MFDIRIATIAHLRARKQRYKLKMFERLHYILLSVVMVIAIFFVISSMSFSGRFAEGSAFFQLPSWCLMILKIMLQILGKRDGGCWMVTWPFSILRPSRSLYSYGAPAKTIEDKFGLLCVYHS